MILKRRPFGATAGDGGIPGVGLMGSIAALGRVHAPRPGAVLATGSCRTVETYAVICPYEDRKRTTHVTFQHPARKRTKVLRGLLGDHQGAAVAREHVVSPAEEAHRAGVDAFGYGLLHSAQTDTMTTLAAAPASPASPEHVHPCASGVGRCWKTPRTPRVRAPRRAARAAFAPGAPWTPPPGWAEDEAR